MEEKSGCHLAYGTLANPNDEMIYLSSSLVVLSEYGYIKSHLLSSS